MPYGPRTRLIRGIYISSTSYSIVPEKFQTSRGTVQQTTDNCPVGQYTCHFNYGTQRDISHGITPVRKGARVGPVGQSHPAGKRKITSDWYCTRSALQDLSVSVNWAASAIWGRFDLRVSRTGEPRTWRHMSMGVRRKNLGNKLLLKLYVYEYKRRQMHQVRVNQMVEKVCFYKFELSITAPWWLIKKAKCPLPPPHPPWGKMTG